MPWSASISAIQKQKRTLPTCIAEHSWCTNECRSMSKDGPSKSIGTAGPILLFCCTLKTNMRRQSRMSAVISWYMDPHVLHNLKPGTFGGEPCNRWVSKSVGTDSLNVNCTQSIHPSSLQLLSLGVINVDHWLSATCSICHRFYVRCSCWGPPSNSSQAWDTH